MTGSGAAFTLLAKVLSSYAERVIGLIADFFRFNWALFYWNVRKTFFRARRRSGVSCPCQNPSDSGRAMETGCDAAISWKKPTRFRHVCPLLKCDATGRLVCASPAQEVRPFWGRAALYYTCGLLAFFLCGAVSFFVVQRALGKPLSLRQVVWPPAWKEYPQVQSRYFFEKARAAIANKAINDAVADLSVAYQLDPKNYVAGFTLAQICQIGQPELAERIYGQLVRDHLAQRSATLVAWYQALLTRGDFKAIRLLAAEALKSDDPARASSWLHTLVFAQRRDPSAETLKRLIADPLLPPQARTILELELRAQDSPSDEVRTTLLRQELADTYPYFDYYRVQRLIELGYPEDALGLMGNSGARLGSTDRRALWLDAHATMGWTDAARREVAAMLGSSPDQQMLVSLCAHLIRHPDHTLSENLFARLRQIPLPSVEANYGTFIALMCAAGVNDDQTALREMAATVRLIAGNRFRSLDDVVMFFRAQDEKARIETHLPALQPQPIEITYALLQHFHRTTFVRPK